MKKLSLKKLNLNTGDLLQKEQLKTVFGGFGGYCGGELSACSSTCNNDAQVLYGGSMTDAQIIAWFNACISSCCNG
ncbi:hypothetical protein [Maribacter sp. 2304DJ31-5]|uniref:hypothetical protein n=1 Tax=Maribacter sp. 2304DJ31-5 TaxID=3386273 RepID=UPI0039BCDAA2